MPCHVVMLPYAESVGRITFQSDNIPYNITKFIIIFIFLREFKMRNFFINMQKIKYSHMLLVLYILFYGGCFISDNSF